MDFFNKSVELYSYKEINLDDSSNYRFSIEDFDKNKIEFNSDDICRIKGNYQKGYYIIEGEIHMLNYDKVNKLANWQKESSKKPNRKINLKWNNESNVAREISFLGRCLFYREYYDNSGNMYFEVVIQDSLYNNNNEKFFSVGDCYVHAEIDSGSLRNLKNSDSFWATSGIVLGSAAVIGGIPIVVAGGAGAIVTLTVIYGVNTIVSCTYDLIVMYEGEKEKVGDFNLIRDIVFGGVVELVDNVPKLISSAPVIGKLIDRDKIFKDNEYKKSFKDKIYLVSEIILAYKGLKPLVKKLWNGRKIGIYVKSSKPIMARNGLNGNYVMAQREIMWKKFGYDVYQISNGLKSGKGYVIELGQEMSKATSTASSAIEVKL